MEAVAPYVPLCERRSKGRGRLTPGSIDRVEVRFRGIAEGGTRLLGIAVQAGAFRLITPREAE